jgi:hypothetical protein
MPYRNFIDRYFLSGNFLIIVLFFIYFASLQVAVNYLPVHFDQGYVLGPVKLILEHNLWPVINFLEMHGPNLTLFYLIISGLVGLNEQNISQILVLTNLATVVFIVYYCKKRNYVNGLTISLITFSMFNGLSYHRTTAIDHNVISFFFLTGGVVFLAESQNTFLENKQRLFLILAGFFLGFAACTRIQYTPLICFSAIWLFFSARFNFNNYRSTKQLLFFAIGTFISASYSIFLFLSEPTSFIAMHLTVHTGAGGEFDTNILGSINSVFSDFLLLPEITIPLIFVLASFFICFSSESSSLKEKLISLFRTEEARFYILTLSFAFITILVQITRPNLSRLSDSSNFWVLSTIPFLNRCFNDKELIKKGLRFIVINVLFIHSVGFLFLDSHFKGPYNLKKNQSRMESDQFSKKTMKDLALFWKTNLGKEDIVVCGNCLSLMELPSGYLKGMELPILNFNIWERKISKDLYPLLKIMTPNEFRLKLEEGKVQYALINKLNPSYITPQMRIIKIINGWKIYSIKENNASNEIG